MQHIFRKKNLVVQKKKDPFLVYDDEKKKQGLTVHKADNVKYYVSVDIYLNRENKQMKQIQYFQINIQKID